MKENESKYFEDDEPEEKLKNNIEENKASIKNVTDVYLSFFDIYEKCLPNILEFYANEQNRPKRKIPSTYRNSEIEILGTLNISIIELIKTFFELLLLNNKNKVFGYKNGDLYGNKRESLFLKMENELADKLKILLEIMFTHNFFKVSFNDLLRYEMNNHLQILIKSIISSIVDYSESENKTTQCAKEITMNISELLIPHILIEIDLLNFIIFNSLDKIVEFQNTKYTINSGYTPCLVEIAEKINNAKSDNRAIKAILNKSKPFFLIIVSFG